MMYKRYLLFKTKENILTPFFVDFLKGYLGYNIKIEAKDEGFVIFYNNNIDVKDGIYSLIVESNYTLKVFISNEFSSLNNFEENYNILSNYFFSIDLKNDIYNEKELIKELILNGIYENLGKVIFKELYQDKEMLSVIKTYLECDMNVIKASNMLYMHRNTLNNKIDKFNKVTGYDVKSFKDSFIIYHLL